MLIQWTQKIPLLPRLRNACAGLMVPQKKSYHARSVESPSQLKDILEQHGIPVELYGVNNAKSINKLWEEIEAGETVLHEDDDGTMIRSLYVVVCRIKDEEGRVLYEAAQRFSDGRRRVRNQPLSEKMKPGENPCEAAKRGIAEELGDLVTRSTRVDVTPDVQKPVEKNRSVSKSYPGLLSQYTVYRVNASLNGLPSGNFSTTEVSGDVGYEHEWEWVRESEQ